MNAPMQQKFFHFVIAGLSSLVIMGLAFAIVWKDRSTYDAMAGVSVLNTAEVVAQQVETSFQNTFELLQSIASRYERNFSTGPAAVKRLASSVALEIADFDMLSAVQIANAEGELVFTTDCIADQCVKKPSAQKLFFKQAAKSTDEFFFHGPLQDHPGGQWSMIMARRIVNAQGVYRGIVYGTVPVECIGKGFSRIDLGPNGIINLRTIDFSQVVRSPALTGANASTGNRNVSQTIQNLMRQAPNQDAYIYTTVAPIDGQERVYAYKKFHHSPFWMSVGRATGDFKASYWQTALVMTILSLAMTIILFGGAWRLSLQSRKLQQRIQEKNAAEKQVQESEERLSSILNNLESCVYLKNTEGRYTYANRALCDLLGVSLKEIIGQKDSAFCVPTVAAETERKEQSVLKRGEILRYEESSTFLSSGAATTFMTVKLPLRKEDGSIYALCGISTDISKRISYEQELHKNRQFLRSLADNLPGLVGYYSSDLYCLFANTKYQEWFGNSPEELEGAYIDTVLGEKIFKASKAYIDATLQGKAQSFEREMIKANGERVTAWVQYIPDSIAGEVKGFFVYVSDITDIKKAQQETELLSAQLLQAQKMEAIGTLAGGIAHDFNNILGAILGYAEMAKDALPAESKAVHDIEKVQAAGHRAADLVKQILAFSRQDTVDQKILSPVILVKETIKLLRSALPTTIEIKQYLHSDTGNIIADPTQIHQIVMNLCTNAFHAMEDSGGVLEVRLENCTLTNKDLGQHSHIAPGSFIHLAISDTGPGIPAEISDRIFEPYFTTKGVGKGTGLGLSLVHGIITSLKGFVHYETSPKNGTTFHVYIPATQKKVHDSDAADNARLAGKERILLIDDEQILVEMEKTMLERLGYQVTVCSQSEEALATFEQHPQNFDAVVTDQTMPGMTGMELAKKMRRIRADIPIILCTGYSSSVNKEQALQQGIQSFLLKPVDKTMLAKALRKAFDQGESSS